MNSRLLEKLLKDEGLKVFGPSDLTRFCGVSCESAKKFIQRNRKRGSFVKLRNDLYAFADERPSEFLLSNRIYSPSYVSLETALSFYQMIPEVVYAITSVTPKATRTFEAYGLTFTYQRIKRSAFTGYEPKKVKGDTVMLATPEKAVVDYLYFASLGKKSVDLRLNPKGLSKKWVLEYTALFDHRGLDKLSEKYL